ncbi:hypothetical protein BY458DRAFT_437538 [Sporodiniella umbellata]|nr:hypothetical protein BY458DRAFT_437538 [Sporodiniella umbellata]
MNDIVNLFLQANRSTESTIFTDLLLQTLQNESPSLVTQELLEQIQKKSQKRTSFSPAPCPLEKFPIIVHLQEIFNIDSREHQDNLSDLIPLCTETAFFYDLKNCIHSINSHHSLFDKRDHFLTKEAYEHWQQTEIKQLTEKMNSIILLNPKLSANLQKEDLFGKIDVFKRARSSSISSVSVSSILSITKDSFLFIPPDPKTYFRYLMNICVDYNSYMKLRPSHLLSLESEELLNECWETWRLSWPFYVTMRLSSVKSVLSLNKIHIEETQKTIELLEKVLEEHSLNNWEETDFSFLKRVLIGLNNALLHVLASKLSEYWNIVYLSTVEEVIELLEKLSKICMQLGVPLELSKDVLQLEEAIKSAAVKRWQYIEQTCKEEKSDLSNLIVMVNSLCSEFDLLINRGMNKLCILSTLSVMSVIMSAKLPYLALEMENWSLFYSTQECSLDAVLDLYYAVSSLNKLYHTYSTPESKNTLKIESWFMPHIKRWLHQSSNSMQNKADFETSVVYGHQTIDYCTLTEVFSILEQSTQFLVNLHWPNYDHYCLFQTRLLKAACETIENYCGYIKEFIEENIKDATLYNLKNQETHISSFFDLSKLQMIGNKRSEREEKTDINIQPEICIKLNSIVRFRCKLEKLYNSIKGDKLGEHMKASLPTKKKNHQVSDLFYSVELVCSNDLHPLSNNKTSNHYVVLEINGKEHFKTKTVSQSLNPRWNDEVSIKTQDRFLDALAIVYSEDSMGVDEEYGSVWFKLSQDLFDDCLVHEIQLPLYPHGTITLRICLLGEEDNIEFWFKKTTSSLQRIYSDLVSSSLDKLMPCITHYLSRSNIAKVLCRNNHLFHSFGITATSNRKYSTIEKCEEAIYPLISFLEENFNILCTNLPKPVMNSILLKILFNGGEDGDAIPLESLECNEYHSLQSLHSAYHSSTEHLISLYQKTQKTGLCSNTQTTSKIQKLSDFCLYTDKKSKTIKEDANSGKLPIQFILRLLRMRQDKEIILFLQSELEEKRKNLFCQENNSLFIR